MDKQEEKKIYFLTFAKEICFNILLAICLSHLSFCQFPFIQGSQVFVSFQFPRSKDSNFSLNLFVKVERSRVLQFFFSGERMFIKRTIIHTVRLCGGLSECWLIWRPLKLKLVCNLTVKSPDKFVESLHCLCWRRLLMSTDFCDCLPHSFLRRKNDLFPFVFNFLARFHLPDFERFLSKHKTLPTEFFSSLFPFISFEEFHFSLSKFLFKITKLVTILITI